MASRRRWLLRAEGVSAMFVDTHLHLDDERYAADRADVVARSAAAGVTQMITIGTNLTNSRAAIALAEQFPGVYAAVGVHPNEAADWDDQSLETLRALAQHPKVVAIGEIGLDYYWERVAHDQQAQVFQAQLGLARALGKPVIIHDREAHGDVLATLQTWVQEAPPTGAPGVLHCFSGDDALAATALALGFFLGVDGPLTFKNARGLQALVAGLPLDRLLIETDAPYLAPHPYRGQRNEPAYVVGVAQAVATLHHCSLEHVATMTTTNARRLFGLPAEAYP